MVGAENAAAIEGAGSASVKVEVAGFAGPAATGGLR